MSPEEDEELKRLQLAELRKNTPEATDKRSMRLLGLGCWIAGLLSIYLVAAFSVWFAAFTICLLVLGGFFVFTGRAKTP